MELRLKIGFMLPVHYAVGNPGNGIRMQAVFQAGALERAGHEVVRLNPWEVRSADEMDVVQYFAGGFPLHRIEVMLGKSPTLRVFAPIIDSNVAFWKYRLAAAAGGITGRFQSVGAVLRQQAVGADLVICRSKHERERLVRGLGVEDLKIRQVLNGTDPPTPGDAAAIRKKFGLPEKFLLHIGAYGDIRKNVARLIEAVGPLGYPLVIAGHAVAGGTLETVRAVAAKYPQVKLLGFVQGDELNGLYAACHALCLPSIHEGTGLVAVEAAAHGAGVMITRNGGPPDYFLDFVEYVDPFDVDSIARAARALWDTKTDGALRRHVLENLTWDQSAKSLVDAYQEAIAAKRRK